MKVLVGANGQVEAFSEHCEISRSAVDSSTRRRSAASAAGPRGAGEPGGAGPGDGGTLEDGGRGMAASCSRLAAVCIRNLHFNPQFPVRLGKYLGSNHDTKKVSEQSLT